MKTSSSIIKDRHLNTFIALADGLVHETSIDNIRDSVAPGFSEEELKDYVNTVTRPSDIPQFREMLSQALLTGNSDSEKEFAQVMDILDAEVAAQELTDSPTLIRDMTLEQRENLLRSWRDSDMPLKRKLFRSVFGITIGVFVRLGNDLHLKASGYPGKELRDSAYENQIIDHFKYEFMEKPHSEGEELYLPEFDALIIGSGCGAGAVAHTLAEKGFKSLILEKGKYFSTAQLNFNDLDGISTLFENGGNVATTDQEVFFLSGSNFGGGSTVNWSASLRTPFKVRKEWYDEFGLDFAASDVFDKCQQYVWDKMGVGHDGINHSFANTVLLDGCEELGYNVKVIDQNTGRHPSHKCGFCHLGCKFGIKQSTPNNWFRDSAASGSKFMEQVKVLEIVHSKGVASGVICKDIETGIKFKITGPKKYIVSGGSLSTPIILQNSGFKNKNIGKNLKIHPAAAAFGDFGNEVRATAYADSIMTSVCTEVDDLDGKAHGPKIETLLNAPFMQAGFAPWFNSDSSRQFMLRYNNMTAMLIITRDTGSGSVKSDPERPDSLCIDYEVSQFDRDALLKGLLIAADVLYIQGAKRIISPSPTIPIFESVKPKDKRSIDDEDYVAWRNTVSEMQFHKYGISIGSAHQMASCRMSGRGPEYGACDEKGRLFECSNVYVADASVMPTASGVNPSITTYTFARYIGLNVAKELKSKSRL
ncbi:Long-chain-alcohol oxidase FAO2 [Spathaspora sp. JA1]|nr:Long-chain-alcohol oxidase FAO2 [Spathaspora sp. JA1]